MARRTSSVLDTIARPPVVKRALLAALLLVGFYLTTIGVACAIAAIPILYVVYGNADGMGGGGFALFILAFAPLALIRSLFRVRPVRFVAPGTPLRDAEAPGLFAMLRELAEAAGTAPPDDVYLVPDVSLAVTEARGRRVLLVGAALLSRSTVAEVRAGLAHELGHFAFGHTRTLGVSSLAHGLFRAILETGSVPASGMFALGTDFARSIAIWLGSRYARVFFRLTRPADRRLELAADELAVKLVGAAPLVSLLERMGRDRILFELFAAGDVAPVLDAGAVPEDTLAWFGRFCDRMRAEGKLAELDAKLAAAEASPYDTHPPDAVRFAEARRHASQAEPRAEDGTPAAALFAFDLERRVADHFAAALKKHAPLADVIRAPWEHLAASVYAPAMSRRSLAIGRAHANVHLGATSAVSLFAVIARDLANGQLERIVVHAVPTLAQTPAHLAHLRAGQLQAAGAEVVGALLAGALLERGAVVEVAPGFGMALAWEGERVDAEKLAREAMTDSAAGAEVLRLAERLAGVGVAGVGVGAGYWPATQVGPTGEPPTLSSAGLGPP